MKKKNIIGLTENIKIIKQDNKSKIIKAKVDTGAAKSSLDIKLAAKLNLGPVIKSRLVKSANGKSLRPVIQATVEVCGKKLKRQFTLADRGHLKYKALIGVNILKHGFLIDPAKK